MPGDNDSPGISAVAADVARQPLDDCADVLGPSGPPIVRRKPIIHRYADHAMPDGPATDMVVERKVSHLLVAGGVSATVHKNEHRPRRHPNCPDVVNVQSMSRMGSVGYVALDSRRQIVSGPLRSHIQLVRALDHLRCELATEFTQPPPNLNSVVHIASIAGFTSRRPSSRPVPATTTGFAGTTNSIGSRRRHTEFRKTIRQPFLRAAVPGIMARSDTLVEGSPCDARLTADKHRGHSRRRRADPA